jgi:RNA polymerase sigma factor (sigma-70 family)
MIPGASIQIADYLPLIRKEADRRQSKWGNRSGAVSFDRAGVEEAGFQGLVEAVATFDPGKNSNLEAWIVMKIRWAIQMYFRKMKSLNGISKDADTFLKQRALAVEKLMQLLGRLPTEWEIAEEMGLSLEVYREKMKSYDVKVDLAKKENGQENFQGLDVLPTELAPADEVLNNKIISDNINHCMKESLDELQRTIFLLVLLQDFKLREVVEIVRQEEIKNTNDVDYQLRKAKTQMAACLKKRGINLSSL